MRTPTASGIGAFLMGCLAFAILLVVLLQCQGCQTWSVAAEPDFTRPVEEMRFRAEIGGRF